MKSHISVTIDEELVREAKRFGQAERRSRSQVVEMALEQFLRDKAAGGEVVTSPGRFSGRFSREETYAR